VRLFAAVYPPEPAVDDLVSFVSGLRVGLAFAAGVNTRLARPDTLHLTMAFLGDVADERLDAVTEALGRVIEVFGRGAEARARRRGAPARGAETPPRAVETPPRPIETPGRPIQTPAPAVEAPRAVDGPTRPVDGPGRASEGTAPRVCLAGGGRFGRGSFTVLWTGLDGDVEALRGLAGAARRSLRKARLPYDDRPWKPHLTIARPGNRLDRAAVDADRAALAGYRGPTWPAAEVVLMRSHLGPRPSYDKLAAWPLRR
jgi:2'-5' RNA ligase